MDSSNTLWWCIDAYDTNTHSTCIKDAIWNEESSHSYADQHQKLDEPETEKKKVKLFWICAEQTGFSDSVQQS